MKNSRTICIAVCVDCLREAIRKRLRAFSFWSFSVRKWAARMQRTARGKGWVIISFYVISEGTIILSVEDLGDLQGFRLDNNKYCIYCISCTEHRFCRDLLHLKANAPTHLHLLPDTQSRSSALCMWLPATYDQEHLHLSPDKQDYRKLQVITG